MKEIRLKIRDANKLIIEDFKAIDYANELLMELIAP